MIKVVHLIKKKICSSAVASKNIEILKYLRDLGCQWNEETCSIDADNGDFEISS